ncbi:hypothetical protein JW721_02785 [Candidatus Micrarchaeota archaeon]|nr:hypothetical protein [Candidatus Micrarchaeota archaeon]
MIKGRRVKGQVAIEFLMYAGLFMIIAIAAFVLTSFAERGDVGLRESQLLDAFAYRFASAPTIAYKGGEGTVYDISFPKKLDGKGYEVVYVCLGDKGCSVQVSWAGSYGEYAYSYVIAPAKYVIGDSDLGGVSCLETPDASEITNDAITLARRFNPEASAGRLVFRNTGFDSVSSEYPTIELYCSYEGED